MTIMDNSSELGGMYNTTWMWIYNNLLIGYPFGIMEYYSEQCFDNGNLLLYMSDLQVM